ncbi:DUF418 domain-containing protein [Pseudoneobacillus sp. C159]
MRSRANPIQEKERIQSIDAMRGFAILGIFLTNMIAFHSPVLYLNPYLWWSSKSDQTIYSLIDFFVQASFYPLFAMLFGFGLMIMRERSIERGFSFTPIAMRRLLMLLVIGCIHAFLIWHGDILIIYALFGFVALLFLGLSGKALLWIGVLTYLIPNILFGLLLFLASLFSPTDHFANHDKANQAAAIYQHGSYSEITVQRIQDWSYVNNLENLIVLFFGIFPLILIGAGIAKLKWVKNMIEHKKRFKLLLVIFLLAGSLLKLLPYAVRNLFSEYIQDIFGGPLLAVSYAILFILLIEKHTTILKPFQAVGKMAMSNYLFQSFVATLIFYSYGLGLYGKISVGTGTLLVLVIFIVQALISIYWVKNHYYGPIEWVWRAVTYWKIPKWKK